MSKSALLTGGSGQDAAYLAQHLLSLGYTVAVGVRPTSSGGLWRLERLGIKDKVQLVTLDVLDQQSIREAGPADEVYNLAAQGSVGDSWAVPGATLLVNTVGAYNVIQVCIEWGSKLFQAGTADQFGLRAEQGQPGVHVPPQGFREFDLMWPTTPYGISKLAAHHTIEAYRASGKLWACTAFMFNHESPLRSPAFVTQRIAQGVARWRKTGQPFDLHSVSGVRDWGWAPEYVQAMHLMLQQDKPRDLVLATGKPATVLQFLEAAVGEPLWADQDAVTLEADGDRVICRLTGAEPPKTAKVFGDPRGAKEAIGWVAKTDWRYVAQHMVKLAWLT